MMAVAAILDFWVKTIQKQQTYVRIGILMVSLPRKVYSYPNLAAPVQKLIFQDGDGGHLGFGQLEENAGIFARGMGAKYFIKGSKK